MTRRAKLQHPQDYLAFRHHGVHMVRTSGLHERGVYRATVERSGRTYVVTGGHSKRYPWLVIADRGVHIAHNRNFRNAGNYSNLIDVAEGIAHWDKIMYRST